MSQQYQDLDDVIKELLAKLQGLSLPKLPKLGAGLWGILALVWLMSGIVIVQPYEEGVKLRFGQMTSRAAPGPTWNWPYPIGETIKVPVTRVQKLEIGFRTLRVGPPAQYQSVPSEALMLTGDENIVSLEFIVQYKIKNPVTYLFAIKDPVDALKDSAEAAMRQVIGKTNIDLALTEGKNAIQIEALELTQNFIDVYQAGIDVVTVKLQDVTPPNEVNDAFKDVINAKQDKERKINEAKGFKNDVIPAARGEAAQRINRAQGHKESRVTEAAGVAQRFDDLLTEYRKAKQVTRTRLYLETMEKILAGKDVTILSSESSGKTVPYLPLRQRKAGAE